MPQRRLSQSNFLLAVIGYWKIHWNSWNTWYGIWKRFLSASQAPSRCTAHVILGWMAGKKYIKENSSIHLNWTYYTLHLTSTECGTRCHRSSSTFVLLSISPVCIATSFCLITSTWARYIWPRWRSFSRFLFLLLSYCCHVWSLLDCKIPRKVSELFREVVLLPCRITAAKLHWIFLPCCLHLLGLMSVDISAFFVPGHAWVISVWESFYMVL